MPQRLQDVNFKLHIPMPLGVRIPGRQPPVFMDDGRGVEFYARAGNGQWFHCDPLGYWQECMPPGNAAAV